MSITETQSLSAVARLNDQFRRHPGAGWMMTAGIVAKGPLFALAATSAVRAFDCFTDDNDPNGEHDFGSFSLCGERLFWKIDYYDQDLSFGSDDPSDPAVTRRIMTIMLASEY